MVEDDDDLPPKQILKCGLLNVEEREREFFCLGFERGGERERERGRAHMRATKQRERCLLTPNSKKTGESKQRLRDKFVTTVIGVNLCARMCA